MEMPALFFHSSRSISLVINPCFLLSNLLQPRFILCGLVLLKLGNITQLAGESPTAPPRPLCTLPSPCTVVLS